MGSYKDGEFNLYLSAFASKKCRQYLLSGTSLTLISDAKPAEIEAAIEKYLRENPSILKDKLKEAKMEYKPQQLPDLDKKFKIFKKFWAKSKDEL